LGGTKVELTQEEKDILNGKQGDIMQKVIKSVVLFGEAFGAKRLVPIEGPVHLVTSIGMAGLDAVFNMMDVLVEAGVKTKEPFTIDPRPYDFEGTETTEKEVQKQYLNLFANQARYEKQLKKLGLKSEVSMISW
jgi:predicted aconitase